MPTYEYECSSCKNRFEVFQGIAQEPLKRCPKCNGKLNRLIGTGAAIIFRGTGFYQTDYKGASAKKENNKGATCPNQKSNEGCSSCPLKKDGHE